MATSWSRFRKPLQPKRSNGRHMIGTAIFLPRVTILLRSLSFRPEGGTCLLACSCTGSSDCQELGGAQFMLHALNRLSQINRGMFHGSPAKGIIRASQISGQSRQSQNETGLAPRATTGTVHIVILNEFLGAEQSGNLRSL